MTALAGVNVDGASATNATKPMTIVRNTDSGYAESASVGNLSSTFGDTRLDGRSR